MKERGYTIMEILIGLALMLVVGLGVAQMIRSADDSATRSVKQAKQNGALRNAMDTLQSSIRNADRPLLSTPAIKMSDGIRVGGNEMIYTRTEDFGSNSKSYLVERVVFEPKSTDASSGATTGQVVIQRKSFSTAASRDCAISSANSGSCNSALNLTGSNGWTSAPKKLLLDNAQIPSGQKLFVYSAKAGVPATISGSQLADVSLVDINLRRYDSQDSSGLAPATLASTVYLRKIGSNNTPSAVPGC